MSATSGVQSPSPAPAPRLAPPAVEVMVVDAQLPQVPPYILARIAQETASTAERVLALLNGRASNLRLIHARHILRGLAEIGLQAQRTARILGGDYLPAREYVPLDAAVLSTIDAAAVRASRRGRAVSSELHAVTVWMDAAVLNLLLELALDWCLDTGRTTQVSIVFSQEPLHPKLMFHVSDFFDPAWKQRAATDPKGDFDNVPWLLFSLLARSQMLEPQRLVDADGATLVLKFPPPVQETGEDGVALTESPSLRLEQGAPAGGCHVVVVEPDGGLRMVIRQILHEAGMHVEVFANARQAEDLSRHFLAEALVNGSTPDDPDVVALLVALRQRNPGLRVIQLTDQDFLYIGEEGATEAARVGRASVQQALVQAVLLSVGVFAPPTLAARK